MAEERLTEEPLVLSPEDVGKTLLSCDIDDYPGGIVVPVDKPYRWTSADVIRKLKFLACKHFHKKNLKVGHAGTLDPLATGVLLVCIGKATKLAEALQRHEKEYVAGVSFGLSYSLLQMNTPSLKSSASTFTSLPIRLRLKAKDIPL